jgi:amidase
MNALVQSLDLGGTGLSVVVKDCIDIKGTVTSSGSAALQHAAPATDHADVVKSVLDAGCHIIGKAAMHEFAFGMTGVNEVFGTPINPIWPDRIPGGSSSGSAVAVAAGLCDFAIGTDTGGSVRQPAICCGVYGIKPTYGRISRAGCAPVDSSLDSVGVFARTAPMLTRAMSAIDPSFTPMTLDSAPSFARVKSEVDDKIGQHLVYGMMEGLPTGAYITLDGMDEAFKAAMTLIGVETAHALRDILDSDAPMGADVKARLLAARKITPEAVAEAVQVRIRFTAEVDAALDAVDVLITPAFPAAPPTLVEARDPATVLPLTKFLRPFNLTGHPSIVLPCVPTSGSLPMGLQIIGRKGADAQLCAIAEWLAASLSIFRQEDATL